jgi:hypothetical protein
MINSRRTVRAAFFSVLLAVCAAGAGQVRSLPPGPQPFGGLSGIFNNSNFSVKNQFIFSFATVSGSSFLRNVYLSSFSYRPSRFWTLSLDLGAAKFSGLSGPRIGDLTTPVLPLYSVQAEYSRTRDSRLIVNFGNTRGAAAGAGPVSFAPPGSPFRAATSGAEMLKLSDWSLYYEKSFFEGALNVSVYYGHTSPSR